MRRCSRCGERKPLEEFRAATGKRTPQPWCRPCKRDYDREWYQRNRERHVAAVNDLRRQRAEQNRRLLQEAKDVACADCGVRYPTYVMDFDHRGGAKAALIADVVRTWSTERLLEEIDKCDVVCANCHRERTLGPVGSGPTTT